MKLPLKTCGHTLKLMKDHALYDLVRNQLTSTKDKNYAKNTAFRYFYEIFIALATERCNQSAEFSNNLRKRSLSSEISVNIFIK